MQKRSRRLTALLLAAVMMLGAAVPVQAAASRKTNETRNPITSVNVNVTSYIENGDAEGHLEISSNNSQYSIGNTDWGTVPTDGWKVGDEPKVKVYLHARGGYYFERSVSKKTVVVNGAVVSTVKKDDDDETLVITLTLPKVSGSLEEPETAEWVGWPLGKATWEKVAGASAYELKLYRDDAVVYSVERCTGNTFDFYPYMTQSGSYKFRVRAVPVSSSEERYVIPSEWSYSDTMDLSYDETANAVYNDGTSTGSKPGNPSQTGWTESSDGWRYRLSDGSYYKNTWQLINDKWYYFSYDDYMLTGWQKIAGADFYFSGNGDMQTGWLEYGKQWYFLNPSNGRMMTGWNQSNQNWYYMDPSSGVMQTGWIVVNNQWYYLDPNRGGAMSRDTMVGGYYVNKDGIWVH